MLNAARIDAACAPLGFRVHCFAEVDSTNILVKEAQRAGEPVGYVAAALRQMAGYGRQGRVWVSPLGGLYFSLLLKPEVDGARLPSVSPAISLAVRDALAELVTVPATETGEEKPAHRGGDTVAEAGDCVLIKWPNDVVCATGKLCGMSLETVGDGICVGIGINVFAPREASVVGGKNTPAYLVDLLGEDRCFDLERAVVGAQPDEAQTRFMEKVLITCLAHIERAYRRWQEMGFSVLVERYNTHAALIGEQITVVTLEGEIVAAGTVVGIDGAGCLRVVDAAGEEKHISSGEVHLV